MKILRLATPLVFAAVAAAQDPSMPGMPMPAQHGTAIPGKPSPEMKMDMPQASLPQNNSLTWDTMSLQEPEHPSQRTGATLPVPDLLKEVVRRRPMALQEFLDSAQRANPTIAQAEAYVRRSAAQATQAGLSPNPSVGYAGDQIRGGSYGGGEQGAYVEQSIVLGGKLGLRRDIYNRQKQSDQFGVEEQTYRVRNDVTQAFYTGLSAQASVIVRQRLLGLALDAVETVHQLANVGQADAPDILQAEVEAEQAKIDLVTAEREYLQNFRTLAALSGQQQNLQVAPLAGSLEDSLSLDAEQQVVAIIHASPTIKRMQQEISVSEARLKDARREALPDISLKAGERYSFEHVAGAPPKAAGPESFASAGISIPLWNRNQGNVSAAEAELARARQDLAREQLSLRQVAEPLAEAYESARFTADRYRKELIPRAQRAYQLYLQKYQSMAGAYPQVLVSQRTLFQLQIGYVSALHDLWASGIALENYTLRGGLDAPMSSGSPSTSINMPNAPGAPPE